MDIEAKGIIFERLYEKDWVENKEADGLRF